MRKLKTLLILLFAACLSFTLFACGGGDDDKDKEGSTSLNRVSGNQIELTDADTQDTFNTKMQTYKLTGSTDEGRVEILGSDCDITGTINFGVIDRYTVKFTPKTNNENGVSAEVVVVIDHAWSAPDADGKEVCAHDGATRITKDEDVAIHYGGFHYGTGASTELRQDPNAATALPQVVLTEEQASAIGLHAETATGAAFKTAAGINEGKTSSGRIKEFGNDERAGKVVPTITAGDLAPGMSITIEGYAKTDVVGATQDTPGGPWNAKNGNWNCPSYGIADPYSPLCTMANGGIDVGTSVIVRSEGWVLYNGIGEELKNTLGGLPKFIEGGKATESGSTDKANCASWDRATGDTLTGQDVTNRPAYTSSDWKTWWVYSEGQDRHSLDSYQSFIHVRVTWTYSTYGEGDDQVGIIVIDSDYLDEGTTFRSYIKVPAATRGSYRTIIHGDYSTLLITKSSYIETETVTDMTVNGIKAGAQTEYLAGEQIDAGAVFDMQVKSEQNTNWHGGIAVTNDMLYYYTGTGNYAQAAADVEKAADWVAVGDKPLTTDMKIFKIVLERADGSFHRMVPENDCNAIKIYQNNVLRAVGDEYSTALNSNDPMAAYTRTLGKGEGSARYADLTINKALFRAISTTDVFESAPGSDYRYATIRILGIAADGFASITAEQKKTGTIGSDTYYYTYQADGDDVLLAIAIKKAMLGQALTIDGVQDTDIRITFGTGSLGFDVKSSVDATAAKPKLNAGGTVTVTYENLAAGGTFQVFAGGNSAIASQFAASLEGASASAPVAMMGTSGITVTGYETSGTTTTVTFSFPAFDFANWITMPYIRATDASMVAVAEDYVEYDLAFTESTANQSEGHAYFYAQNGTLYFATVAQKITTAGTKANLEGITGGVVVNINNGSADTAKSFNLGYKYSAGTLVFADEGLGDGCALQIVTLEKAYGDYGVVVVASVNIAEATEFTGDFGFQINGVEANNGHYWKYNATEGKIEYTAISGTLQKTVITPGDCYTAGIVASEVKSGNNTVFLAEYTEVGGQHIDEVGDDGYCDLCGSKIDTKAINVWGSNGATMYDMENGDVLDITMTYPDSSKIMDAYACFGVVWTALANGHRYWTLTDGQMQKIPNTSGWDDRKVPYDEAERPDGEQDMWTSLPYNVLNGQVRLDDGTQIDTASAANFKDFLGDATVRYIATLKDGTLTMVTQYFKQGVLAFEWQQKITITSGPVSVGLTIDPATNTWSTANTKFVLSKTNKSTVSAAEGATVQSHAASTGARFATDGFDADGNAKIAVSGMASNEGTAHYLAFKVTFSPALTETTTAALYQADGKTAFTGGYINLNPDRNELEVYVPVTATTGSFLIKFTNFKASTMQSDIVVDLSHLGISNIEKTETGIDALTLAEGTFTIQYTGAADTNTLVVNGGAGVALSSLSNTVVAEGLKATYASATKTVTFTKAAADLSKAIPGYVIDLMDGESVLADTVIAAPIAIGSTYGTQVNTDSAWYAKAEGTTLYLFTNTNANPGTLPLNVNAGYTTLGTNNEGIDLFGVSDLGYTYNDGFNFRLAKETSPLVEHTTGIYTAVGEEFLAVLKIDLTSLKIAADTAYGFAIETEGAGYYAVSATREITASSAPNQEYELRAATCAVDGITVQGNEATKESSTYYGLIERSRNAHTFTEDVAEKSGYDTAKKCTVCGAIQYSQTGVTQSWGKGTANAYAGWGDFGWEEFAVLYKGGSYTITGTNLSNMDHIWDMPEPALTDDTANNYDGYRVDDYNQNDNSAQSLTAVYSHKNNKTNETGNWTVAAKALSNGTNTANSLADGFVGLDGVTITYTFDYTDASKIVITMHFVKGEDIDLTSTVTLTGELADTYHLAFHQDGNLFTASEVTTVVPAGKTAPAALTKHEHGNWNDQDRCPDDNFLNPNHGDTSKGGKAHNWDATDHCTICGILNPEHQHNYNGNGTCSCGAVNKDHTHVYENGECKVCKFVEVNGKITVTDASKTYEATFADGNIVNNDTAENNGLDWWGNGTGSSQVQLSEGDFIAVYSWKQLTIDPNYGHDAIIELTDGTNYFDLAFMHYKDDGGIDMWGTLIEGADSITAPQHTRTTTVDGVTKENAATAYTGLAWNGFYTAKVVRIGTTLTVTCTVVNLDGHVIVVTDTYTGFVSTQLKAGVVGNPYACEELKLYHGALTEKQA